MAGAPADVERAACKVANAFVGLAVACVSVEADGDNESTARAQLSCGEQRLRDRFRCARRRAEFVAGRLAARQALQRLHPGFVPTEILRDETGAPVVAGAPSVQVSISHAKNVAIAVAADCPVGVDLEADEPRPESFARLFLSERERQALAGAPPNGGQELLNVLWTRKEAVSKVGRWGGTLAFCEVDCLEPGIQVGDRAIQVHSASAAGFVLSIAVEQAEAFAYG